MKKAEKITKNVNITRTALLDLFLNEEKNELFKGTQFAHIVYFVDESGSIVVNKLKQLQKFVRTCITVGSDYEARVNRDLVKNGEEGNFTAQSMSGQVRINKYVSQSIKSQKHNLVAIVEHQNTPETVYIHNRNVISREKAIEKGLFQPSHFAENKTSGRGNMSEEKDFNYFTVGFDKIISLKIKGTKYKVID
jgi:hypothetical protein